MRYGFKRGRWYPEAAHEIASNPFDYTTVFGPGVVLVPTPRSSPIRTGDLWPAEGICHALVNQSLGATIEPLLIRTQALPKAHLQTPTRRPSPEDQYGTMAATSSTLAYDKITIVDDFVTRGSTLLAAVSRVAEAYPTATVRAFALVRSISQGEVDERIDPCVGTITYDGGWISRQP